MASPDPKVDRAAAEAFTAAWSYPSHRRQPTWPGAAQCCGTAQDGWQCPRPGPVVLADGSRWCGLHSPAALTRAEDGRAAVQDFTRKAAAYPHLVAALQEIAAGHPDPKGRALLALIDQREDAT